MNRREKEAKRKRKRDARPLPRPPAQAAIAAAQNAEDQVMVALGFDIPGFLRAGEQAAAAAIRADRTVAGVGEAVARVAAVADREVKRHLAMVPPDPPIACDEGCAHCCSLRAEVTVAEVIRVAEHLRRTLAPPALREVRARVLATARRIVGMDPDARAEAAVPCALLEGDRCTVYEARPYVCRGCNSADPVTCEDALADPDATKEVYAPQSALYHYAGSAVMRALSAVQLPHELVELNTALAVALETPDAAARWLAGEPIFRGVDHNPLLVPPIVR
jgi:hypothetical protein